MYPSACLAVVSFLQKSKVHLPCNAKVAKKILPLCIRTGTRLGEDPIDIRAKKGGNWSRDDPFRPNLPSSHLCSALGVQFNIREELAISFSRRREKGKSPGPSKATVRHAEDALTFYRRPARLNLVLSGWAGVSMDKKHVGC